MNVMEADGVNVMGGGGGECDGRRMGWMGGMGWDGVNVMGGGWGDGMG